MHSTAEAAAQIIKTSTAALRKLSQFAGFLSGSNIPAAPAVSRFSVQLLHQQSLAQPGFNLGLLCLGWHVLPPNRPEPPVHRERNRRTDHAGHNQKQQAEAEYRIGKVQRANCAADPNTQGPRDQADAPHVQLEASSGEVAGCVFGYGTASGGNTNYIFTQYYIFAEAICNGARAPKGDLSGCVRPLE